MCLTSAASWLPDPQEASDNQQGRREVRGTEERAESVGVRLLSFSVFFSLGDRKSWSVGSKTTQTFPEGFPSSQLLLIDMPPR